MQVKGLSELTVSELWQEINITEEDVWGDLKIEAQVFLKKVLEGAMEDEVMDHLRISRRYERSEERESQRNGYDQRDLETELGLVRELRVPRTRDGGYQPKVFQRYKRRQEAVNRKEAVQRYWEWAARWRESESRAVECLEKDLDELLTFLRFPEDHRSKIRTTNVC